MDGNRGIINACIKLLAKEVPQDLRKDIYSVLFYQQKWYSSHSVDGKTRETQHDFLVYYNQINKTHLKLTKGPGLSGKSEGT